MTTSMEGERDFGSAAATTPRTGSGDLWIVVALSRRGKAESYMAGPRCGACDDACALHGGAPGTGTGPLLPARVRRRDRRAGTLRRANEVSKVLRVTKEKGVIKHYVDRMPPADEVHGVVDWDRRYQHMRFHTSQNLMSGLVWRIYGARTVGNQLYTDRARVDFQPANFASGDLKRIE